MGKHAGRRRIPERDFDTDAVHRRGNVAAAERRWTAASSPGKFCAVSRTRKVLYIELDVGVLGCAATRQLIRPAGWLGDTAHDALGEARARVILYEPLEGDGARIGDVHAVAAVEEEGRPPAADVQVARADDSDDQAST